jgi:hypothetical protein
LIPSADAALDDGGISRLFHLAGILACIEQCENEANSDRHDIGI